MIVERTHYYAKPGRTDDVLATRRKASEIRARLGLPQGVISVGAGHEGGGPDVAWECAFPTSEAHQRDLEQHQHHDVESDHQQDGACRGCVLLRE